MVKRLAVLACVLFCATGCQEYNDNAEPSADEQALEGAQPGEQVDAPEAEAANSGQDESADRVMAGRIRGDLEKLGRTDLCEILDESMVREVFELDEETTIQHNDRPLLCTYLWDEDDVTFQLGFHFSPAQPADPDAAKSQWEAEKLIESYQDSEQEEVADLGDEAVWSSVRGGELRVLNGKDIFYLQLNRSKSAWAAAEAGVTPPNVEELTQDEVDQAREEARVESKDDAIRLAKEIIKKLSS